MQANLFPELPFQLHSEESREAAELIEPDAASLRGVVLAHIRQCGETGATDDEMQIALKMNPSTQRPRRIELWEADLIEKSGHTRPTKSGRNAAVWIERKEGMKRPEPAEVLPAAPAERFDYASLDPEIRPFVLERTERIHNLARMTAAGIVQIGQYLTEVKARLGHGKFREWIKKEFGWERSSADNFMHVFKNVKCPTIGQLQIDCRALYLIAAPSTPEPVRAEVMRRAEKGEPVNHTGARALVQRFAETGELPEVEISLPEVIEQQRKARKAEQPLTKKLSAAEAAEIERLHDEMKANGQRAHAVMSVIRAIECLASTSLTVPQVAVEIRRLDSPDRDWHGQTKQAGKILAELGTELER